MIQAHFAVPHVSSVTPSEDVPGEWSVCSPETVGRYTACGYFMARRLHAELDVPIGILSSNWGGTRIEPWTPPEGFASVPSLASIAEAIAERSPAHPARKQAAKAFVDVTEAWVAEARRALDAGQPLPERPAVPDTLKPPKDKQDLVNVLKSQGEVSFLCCFICPFSFSFLFFSLVRCFCFCFFV